MPRLLAQIMIDDVILRNPTNFFLKTLGLSTSLQNEFTLDLVGIDFPILSGTM